MAATHVSPFDVRRSDDGRVVRLMLSGELDMATAASLELGLQRAGGIQPPGLVVDLDQLELMGVAVELGVGRLERSAQAGVGRLRYQETLTLRETAVGGDDGEGGALARTAGRRVTFG